MWGSLKNQDGCGSRAFRCCWTRQTCSLLNTDHSRPPECDFQHRMAGSTHKGRAWVTPSGFGPDCAVPGISGARLPRDRQVPCAECLAVSCSPAERNLKTFTDCIRPKLL